MRRCLVRRSVQTLVAAVVLSSALVAVPASAQQTTREQPPPLGTPKPFTLPPRRDFTLANGMKVTFVPFGTIPKVSIYCAVRTGHIDERSNEVALSDVTGDMLREGTTARTGSQIDEDVAGMGGTLSVSSTCSKFGSTKYSLPGESVSSLSRPMSY